MAENIALTLALLPSQGNGGQFAVGTVTFGATAIVAADYVEIDIGFKPKFVEWENLTDRVGGKHFEGMAADSCLKTIANGTRTLEITSGNGGITLTDRGFRVLQNATLALILASKVCAVRAQA
jgi:hypothetical protein